MKPDITGKKDIVIIMQFFYEKAKADKVIGHFFTDVVEVNWEQHIPTMSAFWENVLFYTGEYDGNPLDAHKKIHAQNATSSLHFERWLRIFNETIDQHFSGKNATKMKLHASGISAVMLQQLL